MLLLFHMCVCVLAQDSHSSRPFRSLLDKAWRGNCRPPSWLRYPRCGPLSLRQSTRQSSFRLTSGASTNLPSQGTGRIQSSSLTKAQTNFSSLSQDMDECRTVGKVTCPGPCINLPGTYGCNCTIPGYIPTSNLQFCQDINECSFVNGGCSDVCLNTRGSYKCRCEKAGYRLAKDGHTCDDIDECRRYKKVCGLGGSCANTIGSYVCTCGPGFTTTADRAHCSDNNECLNRNGGCKQVCINVPGSFLCACRQGFRLLNDSRSCSDINECLINNGGCQDRCINTVGSFRCVCRKRGLVIRADRKSCKPCPANTYYRRLKHKRGRCVKCPIFSHTNGPGKKSRRNCKCDSGFLGIPALKIPCQDIDECKHDNFGCAVGCNNIPGSAVCTCPVGFQVIEKGKNCVDENECDKNNGGCADRCVNIEGSAYCVCDNRGFDLAEDGKRCTDVNECEVNNFNCSDKCHNTVGSAYCVCPDSFHLSIDQKTCLDVDECLVQNGGCEDVCVNDPGSHHCECRLAGFRLNSNRKTCDEINECIEQSGLCEDACRNTHGSYICVCRNKGLLLGSDGRSCEDLDECTGDDTNVCDHTCVNTYGSYACVCGPGFAKKGQGSCQSCPKNSYSVGDVTVCTTCPTNAHTDFTEQVSRGACTCDKGYRGKLGNNENQCQDIDECEEKLQNCSHICVNTPGSAYCACPQGFQLQSDRLTCIDRDECNVENVVCEHNCHNTEGAYYCSCRFGYELNPYQRFRCQDINECLTDNGQCSHICVNSQGNFYCTCPRGWFMTSNKKTCEERFCYILAIPPYGYMLPMDCSTPTGEGVTVNTVCHFTCYDGYKLVGSSSRRCLDTGDWDGVTAQCIAIECPKLSDPVNGEVLPRRCSRWTAVMLDKCLFRCKAGYRLVGKAFTECTRQETWTRKPPVCIRDRDCGDIHGPLNGLPNCDIQTDGFIVCEPTCLPGLIFYRPAHENYTCDGSAWYPHDYIPDCVGFRRQNQGLKCGDGMEYRTNISACVQCPSGHYKGSSSSSKSEESDECLPCSSGTYQRNIGSAGCMACPVEWTTSGQGSYSEDQCTVLAEEDESGDGGQEEYEYEYREFDYYSGDYHIADQGKVHNVPPTV